jgi:hypothetical protein
MIWGLNSHVLRGDRGAKPPESRAAAAHVGCCVVFVCVFFEFSYDTHFVL